MLSHSHRAGRAADCLGGLFGAHADDHTKDDDLPLLLRQDGEEPVHPGRRDSESMAICSGPGLQDDEAVRGRSGGSARFLAGGAVGVSNLVRSDAVYKGQERSSLIL